MAIATGILFARPNIGLMSVFLRDDAGAMMARRMVVPAIVVPFLLGLLRFNLEKLGWISTDTGRSLLIILLIVSGTSLIWWNAFFLSKATEQRTQAVLDRDLASKSLAASESRYKDLVHGLPAAI